MQLRLFAGVGRRRVVDPGAESSPPLPDRDDVSTPSKQVDIVGGHRVSGSGVNEHLHNALSSAGGSNAHVAWLEPRAMLARIVVARYMPRPGARSTIRKVFCRRSSMARSAAEWGSRVCVQTLLRRRCCRRVFALGGCPSAQIMSCVAYSLVPLTCRSRKFIFMCAHAGRGGR